MRKIDLNNINQMSRDELVKILLDYKAMEVDFSIQDQVMQDLVKRYENLSKELEINLEEIKKLSITDPLTKVHNRLKFTQDSHEEMLRFKRYHETFAILMIDIDLFKEVNDTFGHDVGDHIIVQVARIAKDTLRQTDHFARWGGEEFIALLVNVDREKAYKLAERIRKNIRKVSFENVGSVTVSIGCSLVKENDRIEDVIKRADNGLYKAKNSGRNQSVFISL